MATTENPRYSAGTVRFPGGPQPGVEGMHVGSRRISIGMPALPEEAEHRAAAQDPPPPHDRTADRQESHHHGYSSSAPVSRDYG